MRKEAIRELAENIHVMAKLDPDEFEIQKPPAVTIYLPIHHTEREGRRDEADRITFKNLAKEARTQLQEKWGKDAVAPIVEKLSFIETHEDLNFWIRAAKGLAFLFEGDDCYVYNMITQPEAKVVVGDKFDMEPLLKEAELDQSCRYKLLLLNTDFFAVLDGDENEVHFEEFPPEVKHYFAETYQEFDGDVSPLDYYSLEDHQSPYHDHKSRKEVTKEETLKFFRYVDKMMNDKIVRNDPTPVILVTLPEHVHMFKEVCTFKTLVPKVIEKDPRGMTGEELVEAATKIMGGACKKRS